MVFSCLVSRGRSSVERGARGVVGDYSVSSPSHQAPRNLFPAIGTNCNTARDFASFTIPLSFR